MGELALLSLMILAAAIGFLVDGVIRRRWGECILSLAAMILVVALMGYVVIDWGHNMDEINRLREAHKAPSTAASRPSSPATQGGGM